MKNYIGLGGNCSVTYQLSKFKNRKVAYPFDWCKISLNQLINVLENNFDENYYLIEIKKLSECHKYFSEIENDIINVNSFILKNKMNIQFAHEVIPHEVIPHEVIPHEVIPHEVIPHEVIPHESINNKLENFQLSLKRRIERFQNLNNDEENIFIRIEIELIKNIFTYFEKINKLCLLLKNYCNNFKLILIINIENENENKINNLYDDRIIKVYFIKNDFIDWKMNQICWNDIFA